MSACVRDASGRIPARCVKEDERDTVFASRPAQADHHCRRQRGTSGRVRQPTRSPGANSSSSAVTERCTAFLAFAVDEGLQVDEL